MIRSLEESQPSAGPPTTAAEAVPGPVIRPVRGLLRDLGPAPSADEIDEARRELWARVRAREPAVSLQVLADTHALLW